MSEDIPWTVIDSAALVDHRFLRLMQDTLAHPDGRRYQHFYIDGGRAPVATIAVTDDNQLVLTRQYRHAAGKTIYDLPGGRVDDGEDPQTAAQRELQEETGYHATHLQHLLFYNQHPGSITTGTHLFLATGLKKVGGQKLDRNEVLSVVEVPVEQVLDLILSGQTIDGSLMLGVLFARAKDLL